MSAVNILVQRNAVHLLSDGISYQPDGTPFLTGPKVALMPHQNCVIAFRGPIPAWSVVKEELAYIAQSFDDLRNVISSVLQMARSHYAHLFEMSGYPDFEITVGGVDANGVGRAYVIPSHHRFGSEPWSEIALEGLVCLPNEAALAEQISAIAAGRTADEIDPEVDGLAIMEAQRAFKFDCDQPCFIGGFAQLSTVTADGVSSRIIRWWQ